MPSQIALGLDDFITLRSESTGSSTTVPTLVRTQYPDYIAQLPCPRDAPRRYLAQALIDQPVQALVLVPVNITPEGSLADPEQSRRFLLPQPMFRPTTIRFFKSPLPDLL
jgi:hypothetical protein